MAGRGIKCSIGSKFLAKSAKIVGVKFYDIFGPGR